MSSGPSSNKSLKAVQYHIHMVAGGHDYTLVVIGIRWSSSDINLHLQRSDYGCVSKISCHFIIPTHTSVDLRHGDIKYVIALDVGQVALCVIALKSTLSL